METFLYIVFFVSCLVLVIAVLLQPGKTDAGALFTSGVSSAAMNPRGTASVLSKLTIGAATVFMLSALMLSLPGIVGKQSVLRTQGEDKTSSTAANTNTNANAANSKTANANSSTSANLNEAADEAKKDETKSDEKPEDKKKDSDVKSDTKDEAKTDSADSESETKSDEKSDEKKEGK